MLWKSAEGLAFGGVCIGGYAESEGGQREECAGAGGAAQGFAPGESHMVMRDLGGAVAIFHEILFWGLVVVHFTTHHKISGIFAEAEKSGQLIVSLATQQRKIRRDQIRKWSERSYFDEKR